MQRVNVTKPFLPPLEEYQSYLKRMWDDAWLTNQGPLLQEFEQKVSRHLGVNNFHFVTNGTLALQVALRSLGITEGEVITTPFSYVATVSSIMWERCTPVFVDIEPDTLCIDASKIEAAITPNTKAIMPVHVFGYPCDVTAIDDIAKKHGLKVIYDGAHAFGVRHKGKSLLSYGDISICSFHATKLFHTIEGGCIVVKDRKVNEVVELTKRFGHNGDDYYMLGTNSKASEPQAAMGLTNLPYIGEIIKKRKKVIAAYDARLENKFTRPRMREDTLWNGAYYPIIFDSEAQLLVKIKALADNNIFPRRYFFPSLNNLPYVEGQACPISEDISKRIICLPLYPDLDETTINRICEVLTA